MQRFCSPPDGNAMSSGSGCTSPSSAAAAAGALAEALAALAAVAFWPSRWWDAIRTSSCNSETRTVLKTGVWLTA